MQNFSSFTPENDPFGERNLGFFRLGDQGFFWRIEYYDPTYRRHSDDPSDQSLTIRVMTPDAGRRVLLKGLKPPATRGKSRDSIPEASRQRLLPNWATGVPA